MNKRVGVYGIMNTVNGKIYVGSSKNIDNRFSVHKYQLIKHRHKNKHLQSSWNKYGAAVFVFLILEETDVTSLLDREKYFIELYNSTDNRNGYNICNNPVLLIRSSETKAKISHSLKQTYKNGYKHPMKGKKLSPERIAILVKAHKGRKQSSEEIEKRIKKLHVLVDQFNLDGKFIKSFPSIKAASEELRIKSPNITRCCKNMRPSAGGYKFKYRENHDTAGQ